jgi:hypothetical protein
MGATMKPTTGPSIVKSPAVRCYWTLALGWGWGNKKPAFSMRYAGFDMGWCGLLQGIGPAGIDELAGCRLAAGFSWQAHL